MGVRMSNDIVKYVKSLPKIPVYDTIPAGTTLFKQTGMGFEDGKFVTYWETSLGTIVINTTIHLD